MRNFIIGFCVIVVLWQASGLLGSSRQDRPSETFLRLISPPSRSIVNPIDNGYFMLLGLTALPSSNPVQTGYEIWLQSNATKGQRTFDLDKPGRFELRIPVAPDALLPEWNSLTPLAEFQNRQAFVRTSTSAYRTLLARYDQWLRMRFDDWGFAHKGGPRIEDLLGAHRLYIVDGFGLHARTGIERLMADLARWRSVLKDARTIAMKVTAQVLLEDDVSLLSRIMNEDSADRTAIGRTLEHLQPLTPSEYSIRWPMQSEFALGFARSQVVETSFSTDDRTLAAVIALARAARLYPEDFLHVDLGQGGALFSMPATQRTWDGQAIQYDLAIKATENSSNRPLMHARRIQRDHRPLTGPDSVPLEFNPVWEPFEDRLTETDARLRLVSLQILMRKPTPTITVPTRLAEVGSRYFDPFTGFPMLWSPTQHKLYSVGKDGLDDGGDSTFDISVHLGGGIFFPAAQPSGSHTVNPS